MYFLNKDVIGGLYPLKNVNWGNIDKAIKRVGLSAIKPENYPNIVSSFVINLEEGTSTMKIDEPQKVKFIGTGLLMIDRSVYAKFNENYPQYFYHPDHQNTEHFNSSKTITNFFPVEIEPESKRMLSEDYYFCYLVRKMGIDIWCLPFMQTTHYGLFGYRGNLQALSNYVGELS